VETFRSVVLSIKGREMEGFPLGKSLSKHLLAGEKESGYIFREGQAEQWNYHSIATIEGESYLLFEKLALIPFNAIATELRAKALPLLRSLARALQLLPSSFKSLTGGIIETWRIFFLQDESILILPHSLALLFLQTAPLEVKFDHFDLYLKPGVTAPFALVHQFTQFLYLALTTVAPYKTENVRLDRWRHLPLSLIFKQPELAWIDEVLAMGEGEQRTTVSAAYSGQENLQWWLEKTSSLRWEDYMVLPEENRAVQTFKEAQVKRVKRKLFWRKRGALISTLIIGGVLLLSALTTIVTKQLAPPPTAHLSPQGIIEEFIAAQDALDLEAMGAALAKGVKNPFEKESSTLFVIAKVREAYEQKNPLINAQEWLAEGRPPLGEGSFLWGNGEYSIEQIGPLTYRVTSHFFSPIEKEEGIEERLLITEFHFINKQGYYLIDKIEVVQNKPL